MASITSSRSSACASSCCSSCARESLSFAQAAGLIPAQAEIERVLDPVLAQARAIARLNDPRGLYAYCWCSAAERFVQSAAQSKMTLPDFPEFMISKPSR